MKVLWFTNITPCGLSDSKRHGGGWMCALQQAMLRRDDVEIAIAYFSSNDDSAFEKCHTSQTPVLLPLLRSHGVFSKAIRFFCFTKQDRIDISLCEKAVRSFAPDIVHVFGTEKVFGLLAERLNIPVVIHLQGLMSPYMNAWVPPGYRMRDYARRGSFNPLSVALGLRALALNRHAANRERRIMESCQAFMGRTEWDRAYVTLYAPKARYFHCEEALRPEFFVAPRHESHAKESVFVSTVSSPLYKGHDVILKTAKTLIDAGFGHFKWLVFGVSDMRFAEKMSLIRATDVNVVPCGSVSAEKLRDELLHATAYVHPSYIDNSPNSICEAQVLGVPVVATNVGGVSSIVDDGKTGFLVPANDPVATARRLIDLAQGTITLPLGWEMGPRRRNDPDSVATAVVEIYKVLLK